MTWVLTAIFFVLLGILMLVSYTARLYTEAGKFLSREFQENIEWFEQHVEPRLKVSRHRSALSMALLEHLSITAITLFAAYFVFRENSQWQWAGIGETAAIIILIIIIFQRFVPYLVFARTRGQWLASFVPILRALIYLCMPLTLMLGFMQSVVSLTRERADEQPEHPSEAVDALIEAGQDEGILEESDRRLIHSVIEFGDKMVREVMTPRPDIIAVPQEMSIAEFTEVLRVHGYTRIPVYEKDIDHIVGIIFSNDVLQVSDSEAHARTVRELMSSDVYFVPETKRGSELMREMQRDNVRMAVVIDEYGGVAGVVTIEDLVEEIIGELRDEDEDRDVVKEADHSYIVSGNMDVDRLDELFGIRRGDWEATTVGGLVTEIAGHIPAAGEVVEQEGLRFEVLQATSRRVQRMRISLADRYPLPQPNNPHSGEQMR